MSLSIDFYTIFPLLILAILNINIISLDYRDVSTNRTVYACGLCMRMQSNFLSNFRNVSTDSMVYVVCIQRQRSFHETIVLYPPIVWFMSFVSNDCAVCHETIVLYPPIVWSMSFVSNDSAVFMKLSCCIHR